MKPQRKGFDLGHVVKLVCEESTEADPNRLAELVLGSIPPSHYYDALAEALPQVVRHHVVSSRPAIVVPPSKASGVGKSWRRQWRRQLDARIAMGDRLNGRDWKLLRDCTAADLRGAAMLRREQAKRMTENADALEELAALLDEYDVETVGELPEDVVIPAEVTV